MQDGKILYAIVDGTCILKLVGAIIYSLSPGFDSFLDKIVQDKEVDSFTIDLTETSYIDSTNLGLLAKLPKFSPDQSSGPPTLISNQDSINEVLHNVGFPKIFNIIDYQDEKDSLLTELPKIESGQENLSRTVGCENPGQCGH